MAKEVTLIRVFVSSPEDLRADRQLVASAAEELNRTSCLKMGVRLEVFSWNTAGGPSFGSDPQAVLNDQLREFDIYIGLMGHTFGSPTPRAGSGTEEEFRLAYERWKADSRSCRLMFYFNEAPVAPSNIDPAQLHKVQEFRAELGKLGGLYWTYSSASGELAEFLRSHLFRAIQDYGRGWGPPGGASDNPLAGHQALDYDQGQLDFAADAEEASRTSWRALAMIGASIVQMISEIREPTRSVTTLRDSGALTASAARQQAGAVASAVLFMAVRIDSEIPNLITGWTAFRKNVMLAIASAAQPETEQERQDLRGPLTLLDAALPLLVGAQAHVGELRTELRKLGNLSRDLRESEERANATLAALVTEIDREIADVRQLQSAVLAKLGGT